MNRSFERLAVLAALACASTVAHSQAAPSETRGQLLYTTHCIGCHTTQMHWRNEKRAYDWDSLKFQVRRWQGNIGLQWGDADIAEVARYLNTSIYQYRQTSDRIGMLGP